MRWPRNETVTLLALAGAVCAGAVLFIRGPAFFLAAPVFGIVAGLGTKNWRAAVGVATCGDPG